MPQMHWCTARVNLSGQGFHIVVFEKSNPISWPEVQVLMALHGDENVMDIRPVAVTDTVATYEKERLIAKYTYPVVEQVFPGRSFRMELMFGDAGDLPTANEYGVVIEPEHTSTEIETASTGPQDPPMGAPVMKPGRFNRPPQPGA